MAVKYKDYYKILGVDRTATKDEIQRDYRRLARKYHPDFNPKDKAAEEKFKDIQEAYAALSDPEKRRRYDQLGSGWQGGVPFTPPPGWKGGQFDLGSSGGFSDLFGGLEGFSDFFQSAFGGMGEPGGDSRSAAATSDVEAEISLSLEQIYAPRRQRLTITSVETCSACGGRGQVGRQKCPACSGSGQTHHPRRVEVNLPTGLRDGSVLRLKGKGHPRGGRKPAGDLFLRVKLKPHPRFTLLGQDDVEAEVPISPWEAVLGARITAPGLEGSVEMKVPPNTQGGRRLRIRGRGLSKRKEGRGDLFVRLKIVIPPKATDREKELLSQLAAESTFNARGLS